MTEDMKYYLPDAVYILRDLKYIFYDKGSSLSLNQSVSLNNFKLSVLNATFIATTRSFIFIAQSKRHETVARHPFMSQ